VADANPARPRKPTRPSQIFVQPWDPETPYLSTLEKTPRSDRPAVYLRLSAEQANSPAFYLDCADFFQRAGEPDLALQVLSNLAELRLDDAATLRALGSD